MSPTMKTLIEIENMMCSGCASGIKKQLEGQPDISKIDVDLDNQWVALHSNKRIDVQKIERILLHMGYPKKNALTGLPSLLAKAKSFLTCTMGKLSI